MKTFPIYLIVIFFSFSCAEKNQTLTIKNPHNIDFILKDLSISLDSLKNSEGKLPYLMNSDGITIPSQLIDDNGDNVWDRLIFQVTNTELAKLLMGPDGSTFYFYVGWEKENNEFVAANHFKSQVEVTAEQLSKDLSIEISE